MGREIVCVNGGRAVNKLLEQAIAEVSKLPESEQEAFAAWMLEELASERRWQESFAKSADVLAQMGEEALAEYRRGETEVLDPDKL
jgi:hypothetical protein